MWSRRMDPNDLSDMVLFRPWVPSSSKTVQGQVSCISPNIAARSFSAPSTNASR